MFDNKFENSTLTNLSTSVVKLNSIHKNDDLLWFIAFKFIASFFSLINLGVFFNLNKLNLSLYKYFMIISFVDLLYSILPGLLGLFSAVCGRELLKCFSLYEKINIYFYVVISEYLTSCLALYSILIENFLTIQRILIITNRTNLFNKQNKIRSNCLHYLIVFISFSIYFPFLFRIKLTNRLTISF